jgi:hypothetical protein
MIHLVAFGTMISAIAPISSLSPTGKDWLSRALYQHTRTKFAAYCGGNERCGEVKQ